MYIASGQCFSGFVKVWAVVVCIKAGSLFSFPLLCFAVQLFGSSWNLQFMLYVLKCDVALHFGNSFD